MATCDAYLHHLRDAPFCPRRWLRVAQLAGIRPELGANGQLVIAVADDAESADVVLLMSWLEEHRDEVAVHLSQTVHNLH